MEGGEEGGNEEGGREGERDGRVYHFDFGVRGHTHF